MLARLCMSVCGAYRPETSVIRKMLQYIVNKCVFSRRLKLSLPRSGSLKLSGIFQSDGPATERARCAERTSRNHQINADEALSALQEPRQTSVVLVSTGDHTSSSIQYPLQVATSDLSLTTFGALANKVLQQSTRDDTNAWISVVTDSMSSERRTRRSCCSQYRSR